MSQPLLSQTNANIPLLCSEKEGTETLLLGQVISSYARAGTQEQWVIVWNLGI